MVGLSAAQGYAQVCGLPAAVIVHVDCGTQALAGAVHNASTSRTPVFIYAGASPYTENGELQGSRNEFIHWLQVRLTRGRASGLRTPPDHNTDAVSARRTRPTSRRSSASTCDMSGRSDPERTLLRSCTARCSLPIRSRKASRVPYRPQRDSHSLGNGPDTSCATSAGPVYVWAQREATEEFMDPSQVPDVRAKEIWSPIELNQLNKSGQPPPPPARSRVRT